MRRRIKKTAATITTVTLDWGTASGSLTNTIAMAAVGADTWAFLLLRRAAHRRGGEDLRATSRMVAYFLVPVVLLGGLEAQLQRMFGQADLLAGVVGLSCDVDDIPARLITLEIGMRFLTDYLDGDVYFKVARDGHNLDRCRKQFKMVQSMEAQMDAMERIVAAY